MKTPFSNLGPKTTAGFLLFAGGLIILFGIMLAEFTFPGYSESDNYISDLGNFGYHSTPAYIFNVAIIIFGAMALYAGYLLRTALDKWLGIIIILCGIGGIGVGIFNEGTILPIHYISAFTVFIIGGIGIFYSARVYYKAPISYIFYALSLVVLFFITFVLYNMLSGTHDPIRLGLGPGGMERMVAYPTIFWTLATGVYLLAQESMKAKTA